MYVKFVRIRTRSVGFAHLLVDTNEFTIALCDFLFCAAYYSSLLFKEGGLFTFLRNAAGADEVD